MFSIKKRATATVIILFAAVITSGFPTPHASAAAYTGTFNFTNDGTNATVTGCTTSCNGMGIAIPTDDGAGHPVTTIGDGAFFSNALTSIVIPSSVTNIGSTAFKSNTLTSVVLSNTLTTIGSGAFDGNALTSVALPNSVTTLGSEAFNNNALTSVTLPNALTVINTSTFSNNFLTSVSLPETLTSIGRCAFCANSLISMTIPNSVTTIGTGAFANNGLTSLTIPSSVTSFGSEAISNNGLKSLTFLGNRPTIGYTGFIYSLACVYYISGRTGWPGLPFSGVTPSLESECSVNGSTTSTTMTTTPATTTTLTTESGATTDQSTTQSIVIRKLQARRIANNAGLVTADGSVTTLKILPKSRRYCVTNGTSVFGLRKGSCTLRVSVKSRNGKVRSRVVTLPVLA